MPPAKKEIPSKKNKTPSFEEALEELESMVETMESGQLPLEKLISSYERGAALILHCESVLGDARKRLELITLKPTSSASDDTQESTQESTQDLTQEDAQEGSTHSNEINDDEIRLF